jgi:signal transduction histidine kinase
MTEARSSLEVGVRVLRLILLLLVGLFVLANVVTFIEMAGVQAANDRIVRNSLGSVATIARITQDLAQERILVYQHIFARSTVDMARLEQEIIRVQGDYQNAARSYAPLVVSPSEQAVWERLQAHVAATREPEQEILHLSGLNRADEAAQRLSALRDDSDAISRASEQLIRINRDLASRAAARIHLLHRRQLMLLAAITIAGTLLTLIAAGWVMRIARRRKEEITHWTDLLEARNRDLDAFAGRVAHDLRGPLTTIGLSAAQLAKRMPQEEGTTELLRRGVARMETLIEDLLTLSRIDAQATLGWSNTVAVVSAVEEDLAASVKGVDGILRILVEPAVVRCSEGMLRQALLNLGENAVKYRRPDVRLEIEIKGRSLGRSYEFRVSDNGAGMSRDVALHAFEPFFRGEQARATPGTGLGLSIVRRVIEANGGNIVLETQAGRGTTFVVTLPLGHGGTGR